MVEGNKHTHTHTHTHSASQRYLQTDLDRTSKIKNRKKEND